MRNRQVLVDIDGERRVTTRNFILNDDDEVVVVVVCLILDVGCDSFGFILG